MGEFLNQYVKDLHSIIPLGIGSAIILSIFSILYNRWVSDLGEKKDGYTALLVAIGNTVTILIGVAVFSWKAAVLCSLAFIFSGFMMIAGDIKRSSARREKLIAEAQKTPRRKPLPYRAGRLISDAYDELVTVERKLEQVIDSKKYDLIPLILAGVSKSLRHISEARNTEGE